MPQMQQKAGWVRSFPATSFFLPLPQQDVRWEAPDVKSYPETQMILPRPLSLFLLVDHAGSATQSSHTRQKDVVE